MHCQIVDRAQIGVEANPPDAGDVINPLLREPLIVNINGAAVELGEFGKCAYDMTVTPVDPSEGGLILIAAAYPDGEARLASVFWPADRDPLPPPPPPTSADG